MNKNNPALWAGVIAIIILAGAVVYTSQNKVPADTNDSTTPPVTTGTGTGGDTTPPAQSFVPGAPQAVTQANVSATDTTAVVAGTVMPGGVFTSYWYEYGPSSNLGSQTPNQAIGSGYAVTPAPAYITGLKGDTTYYFRLVAANQYGKSTGLQYSFRTTHGNPPPVGSAPSTKTLAATAVSRTTANLNGYTNPDGAAAFYWFEYGKTQNLGNSTSFVSAGGGNAPVTAAQSISNLDPLTTYYFRLDSQNQFGTVNGSILSFKTTGPASASAPTVDTTSETGVGSTTATLHGTVDPNGAETTYWFEYSTGSLTGSLLPSSTDHISAGAGSSSASVQANISGLSRNTTYYYRIVAQNGLGAVRGDTETFRTSR